MILSAVKTEYQKNTSQKCMCKKAGVVGKYEETGTTWTVSHVEDTVYTTQKLQGRSRSGLYVEENGECKMGVRRGAETAQMGGKGGYMIINISNSTKAVFGSLSMGDVFMLNETDVCVKIDQGDEWSVWNAWNFRSKNQQTIDDNTEVIIPKEVSMEVIL